MTTTFQTSSRCTWCWNTWSQCEEKKECLEEKVSCTESRCEEEGTHEIHFLEGEMETR